MNLQKLFCNDPFALFYNLEKLSAVALTADIDWAPDYAIESVFDLISQFNFNLTVFATHDSELLRNSPPPFLEVGLHPDNTRPHPEFKYLHKIADLKDIYTNAVGLRCHRNFFGQNISDLAKKSGLIYDISTFLWRQPLCQIHKDYNELIKFCYMWEDGIHADTQQPWEINAIGLDTPGLKVLNVHPMLIYLNCPNDSYRRNITRHYQDLTKAPHATLKSQIYEGYGFQSFYRDMLLYLQEHNIKTYKLIDMVNLASNNV